MFIKALLCMSILLNAIGVVGLFLENKEEIVKPILGMWLLIVGVCVCGYALISQFIGA